MLNPARKKRKRTFKVSEVQIEPYRKKPKISKFQFEIKSSETPGNLKKMKQRDTLWMISNSLMEKIPMWVGRNSRLTRDDLPQQAIGYMANLNLSPTRLDAVVETLKISQKEDQF